jgi:hypothetical protein
MQLLNTIRRYQYRLTSPGSPFRILRKAALYAAHASETLDRFRRRTDLLRALPPAITKATEAMERDGFARADAVPDPALLAELGAEVARRMVGHELKATSDRRFWSRITTEEDLQPESIFVRFALQENVVKLATAYMGMVPYLSNIQVLVSFGTEAGVWEESQLWHRDYHDTKTLRLWVYLSDVAEPKHGPFTYLPLTESRQVQNTFFPGRVTDDEMNKAQLGQKAEAVFGPRMSCFAIDTARCYHMGSRVQLGEARVAYLATFNTHATLWPSPNGISVASTEALSPIERLLLTPQGRQA